MSKIRHHDHKMWPDFGKSTTLLHLTPQIFTAEVNHCTLQINITVSSVLYCTINFLNILIAIYVLLWQQEKVLGSIYFMHVKVVDFPKYDHKCKTTITFHVTLSNHKETIHLPSHLFISCVETTHSDLCDFKSTSKIIKIFMVGLYL